MSNASLELGGDNWAAKDGNLLGYAVGDSSGKYVPREFTFTRGSNLAATRIAANGLIEKGRENLLLQSNQFDTTWTTNEASVTSGQSGYDGSSDAWLLEADSDGNGRRVQQSKTQGGVATLSIYAKAGTTDWLRIEFGGAASLVYFDLTNGVLGSETNAIGKIESVGNGWYRCIAVNTSGSTPSTMRYHLASDNNNIAVLTGDNIYIQDAQLEAGMVATDYIETGASTVKAGILENTPRLDYSGGATEPCLLLEPSRTNEIGYSEYKASGDFTNSTPSYNAASSPEGLQNATEMFDNSTNGQHRVAIGSFAVTSGTDYTISAFVKNNDIGYCYLLLEGGFTQTRYYFNLSTGQPITSGLEVENFADGWYRIYVTQSAAAASTGSVYLNMSNNGASPIYVGSSQSLYFYGLQAEEGSYPTSYIPTYGSSETRSADGCDKDGFVSSGITTSSNFTFYMELEGLGQNNNPQVYLEDVSGNRILSLNLVGQKNRYGFYSPDASNYVSPSSNEADGIVKIAVTYDGTDFKEYFNGVEKGTRAASVTVGIDGINFNEIPSNSIAVHKAILFPTALSDADCITLTTL